MHVMIVVTHLLGTGHLSRVLTLARAFNGAGHTITVVSGGMPAPHLDDPNIALVQLLAVRSDGVDFARLLGADGQPVTQKALAERQHVLLQQLHETTPDVLITELFPFGRRILRDEFGSLLAAARALRHPPLICASIRDILAPPSKPQKAGYADQMIAGYYDAVLVHSDASITPLELSWPVSSVLAPKIHYTGFVAPPAPPAHPSAEGSDEIIVSAGGGDVGAQIFATALDAAKRDKNRAWRLLLGGANADKRSAAMAKTAPPNATIEPARPDFRQMLHHAAASISMCGYNTALDVLQTGCPAVFVPFDAGGEVEQGIRANALARRPGIAVVRSAELTVDTMLRAVDAVTHMPRPAPLRSGLDGAATTVQLVSQMAGARR